MNWLRESISDGKTGTASSKRVIALLAGSSMSFAVVLLAVATLFGYETYLELGAVSVPLAGLAGYNYVRGKLAEKEAAP